VRIDHEPCGCEVGAPGGGACQIVCLGNELARDDGAGIRVGRVLSKLGLPPSARLHFHQELGLELLELLWSGDKIVLVDATVPTGLPGRLQRLELEALVGTRGLVPCCHGFGVAQLVALAQELHPERRLGEVVLVGVEAETFDGFDLRLSPAVAEAIPAAVDAVLKELGAEPLSAQGQSLALQIAQQSPDIGSAFSL
jgi:hydrogenase maturation protease